MDVAVEGTDIHRSEEDKGANRMDEGAGVPAEARPVQRPGAEHVFIALHGADGAGVLRRHPSAVSKDAGVRECKAVMKTAEGINDVIMICRA